MHAQLTKSYSGIQIYVCISNSYKLIPTLPTEKYIEIWSLTKQVKNHAIYIQHMSMEKSKSKKEKK